VEETMESVMLVLLEGALVAVGVVVTHYGNKDRRGEYAISYKTGIYAIAHSGADNEN
jgi:hypothetical protein